MDSVCSCKPELFACNSDYSNFRINSNSKMEFLLKFLIFFHHLLLHLLVLFYFYLEHGLLFTYKWRKDKNCFSSFSANSVQFSHKMHLFNSFFALHSFTAFVGNNFHMHICCNSCCKYIFKLLTRAAGAAAVNIGVFSFFFSTHHSCVCHVLVVLCSIKWETGMINRRRRERSKLAKMDCF